MNEDSLPESESPIIGASDAIEEACNRTRHSGFWRRVFAYFVDTLIVGVAGLILGYIFIDYFMAIGQTARLYGLCLYFGYFAVLNSEIGDGRTLGKRFMNIKVVDTDGNYLSLTRSIARQGIVALPIFINGLALPPSIALTAISYLVAIAIVGVGGLICYLLIFNRKTRRSLHDYATGSHVVRSDSANDSIPVVPIWKGHIVVVLAIALTCLTGVGIFKNWALKNIDLTQIVPLYEHLNEHEEIVSAGVYFRKHTSYSNGQSRSALYLQITAFSPRKVESIEEYALKIMGISLSDETLLPPSDAIVITIATGFDLGIAKSTTTWSISDTPANWKTTYENYQASGIVPQARIASKTNIRL